MENQDPILGTNLNFDTYDANLRFAVNLDRLNPKCPFWISFTNPSSSEEDESERYCKLSSPREILRKASLTGLKDCSSAIFSNSQPWPWICHMTRDLPKDHGNEATWIQQIMDLAGQWNPESVGFALPSQVFTQNFTFEDKNEDLLLFRYSKHLIKLIYSLTQSSQIRDFYLYAENQDLTMTLNYLLGLKVQLQKAKISSLVFH